MATTFEIFRFELQEQLRRGATYIFFLVIALVALGVTALLGSSLQSLFGLETPLYANCSTVIYLSTAFITLLGLLGLSGGLFGKAATRDFDANFTGLLVTSGVSEGHYIFGRLAASSLAAMLVLLGIPTGLVAGLALPTNLPENIGPILPGQYLSAYLYLVVPTVIIFGAMFFVVGLLTRSSLWVYLSGLLLPNIYSMLLTPLGWLGLTGLQESVDIYGMSWLSVVMEWTPAEKNTLWVPITPIMLLNRLAWLAVTFVFLFLVARGFRFTNLPLEMDDLLPFLRRYLAPRHRQRAASAAAQASLAEPFAAAALPARRLAELPSSAPQNGWRVDLVQFAARLRFETGALLASKWLWIALLLGMIFSVANSGRDLDTSYGVSSYPLTGRMLSGSSGFIYLLALFLVFILGESLWRERDCGIDALVDTTPSPNWVFFLSKLGAVIAIQIVSLFLFILASIAFQTAQGYYNYELGLYLFDLFTLRLPSLLLLIIPTLLIHILVNNKVLGHFLSLLCFIAIPLLQGNQLPGISPLLIYGYTPLSEYSDIAGYGISLTSARWFQLYWLLLAAVLLILAQLLWPRGIETTLKGRLRLSRQRLQGRVRVTLFALLACLLLTGGWIFYNTRILYTSAEQAYRREYPRAGEPAANVISALQYAERYKPLANSQPTLEDVQAEVDLRPAELYMTARITYTLSNLTPSPLDTILVNDSSIPPLTGFSLNGQPVSFQPEKFFGMRVYSFKLPQPLAPHQSARISFTYTHNPSKGFPDTANELDWVPNGMRLLSDTFLPRIGYQSTSEDLPADPGADQDSAASDPTLHDDSGIQGELADQEAAARSRSIASLDPHKVTFSGRICTDPDQTAFLTGSLVGEEYIDGRRCFSYHTSAPIYLQFFIVSGRFQVLRQQYHGVNLEIYHHPSHTFNLDSLLDSFKTCLDLYTQIYSPYPLDQLRLVEIPGYFNSAISTPGTIIFAESMGMLSKIPRTQKGVVDFPFFVAAHETGHQWWGEQLLPARAKGLYVILETMTQYSAVKAVDAFYGPESVRAFLKYELDHYLAARLVGRDVPLAQASDGKDNHVYYRKGAVVMTTLSELMGPGVMDAALGRFLHDFRQGPPFPLSADLLAYLRQAAPPEAQSSFQDLLETITLWDLRVESAVYTPRPDGRYDVTLNLKARKLRSTSSGAETPVEMQAEQIDIGVLGQDGSFIYLQKHPISSGASTLTITVDALPVQAGIDPVFKLIDRLPHDNVVPVKTAP